MMAKRKTMLVVGFDDKRELVPDSVEDPYDKTRLSVVRNIRESSLTAMRARGHIDDAQLKAGEWFRAKYEKMRMGSMAIDPSYEPVDTSGYTDPMPDRILIAGQDLARAKTRLGALGWPVVAEVCGQGFTIAEVANRRYGAATEAQRKFMGLLLRESLDVLAIYLGYASDRPASQNLVDKRTAKNDISDIL